MSSIKAKAAGMVSVLWLQVHAAQCLDPWPMTMMSRTPWGKQASTPAFIQTPLLIDGEEKAICQYLATNPTMSFTHKCPSRDRKLISSFHAGKGEHHDLNESNREFTVRHFHSFCSGC